MYKEVKLPLRINGFTKTDNITSMVHNCLEKLNMPYVTIQTIGSTSGNGALKMIATLEHKLPKGITYFYKSVWHVFDIDGQERSALVTIISKDQKELEKVKTYYSELAEARKSAKGGL